MADDEKAAKPEIFHPASVSTETPAAEPAESRPRTEWTASDARGPLGTADQGHVAAQDIDVERSAAEAEDPAMTVHEPTAAVSHDETAAPAPLEPNTTESIESTSAEAAARDSVDAPIDPVETEHHRRSLWPVAAGVIIGAVIGAGSAAAVYGLWPTASSGQDPQVASLAARVEALEKRPDADSLAATVTALDHKVAALTSSSSAARSSEPAPAATPAASSVDLDPLQKQVAALQAQIESLKAQGSQTQDIGAKIAALEGAVAGMKTDASSAQAGVQTVEGRQQTMATEQKVLADKVMVPALAVAADSLVQQIDRGEPYATQVAALETLGADPAKIAVLKQNADKGVLSAKALAAKFAPLSEPLSATASKAPPNAGFVDRLKSGMLNMVSIRSVDDTSGTDPASRAAQINTDLAHDDVAGALAVWDALPADTKPKGGEDWSLLAKAHAEAMGAARALQHDAIVALGAKKS